jgi:hypothetical protein
MAERKTILRFLKISDKDRFRFIRSKGYNKICVFGVDCFSIAIVLGYFYEIIEKPHLSYGLQLLKTK